MHIVRGDAKSNVGFDFPVHIMVAKHKKDTFPALTVRQFIAWHIDKEFLVNPGKRIVVLIDMTDAGLTNVVSNSVTHF